MEAKSDRLELAYRLQVATLGNQIASDTHIQGAKRSIGFKAKRLDLETTLLDRRCDILRRWPSFLTYSGLPQEVHRSLHLKVRLGLIVHFGISGLLLLLL